MYKKNVKNLCVCLGTMGLIFVNMTTVQAESFGSAFTNGQKLEKAIKEQETEQENVAMSVEATEEEMKGAVAQKNILKAVTTETEDCQLEYKDYYGGSYINEDGILVIQETNATSQEIEDLKDAVDVDVVIEAVDKSYQELVDVNERAGDQLEEYMEEKKSRNVADKELEALINNITEISIDTEKNANVVYLQEVTEEAKEQYKKYFGEQDVVFEEGELAQAATAIKQGRAIYRYDSAASMIYRCSVGPRVEYTKKDGSVTKGFLSAAHGFMSGDAVYLDAGCTNKIGKVVKRTKSGSVDACLIKITKSSDTTSRYSYYANASGKIENKYSMCASCFGDGWYKGTTMWKTGSTTYLTKGTLESDNVTVKIDENGDGIGDFTLKKQGKLKISAGKGDSGGTVFELSGCDDSKYSAAGITESVGGSYMYFTRLGSIDSTWGDVMVY